MPCINHRLHASRWIGPIAHTLIVLFIVTLGGFAFAFITGFSIGRFVVVLPLLVTAYAVTYGRGLYVQLVGYAAAVGLHLLLA